MWLKFCAKLYILYERSIQKYSILFICIIWFYDSDKDVSCDSVTISQIEGTYLGVANNNLAQIDSELYPIMGIQGIEGSFTANFGWNTTDPFLFDLDRCEKIWKPFNCLIES